MGMNPDDVDRTHSSLLTHMPIVILLRERGSKFLNHDGASPALCDGVTD